MKTIALTAAIATLTIVSGSRDADASDLSQMFRALEATQHTSAPAVRPAPQPVAPVAPRMLLGAWLSDTEGKLQVTGTVPNSPASQTLQPGDVLYRITVADGRTRTLRTLNQFEYAKRQVGPNRLAVLEIFRPGTGVIPMNVTFEANGGLANVALTHPASGNPGQPTGQRGLASR